MSKLDAEIREEPLTQLAEHARIPIAFTVDHMLDLALLDDGAGGFALHERRLVTPCVKDYDAIAGNRPADWARRFDISNWGMLSARRNDRRIGGAVVAFKTKGLHLLEDRDDLAVLWDIRVSPDMRGHGVGARLFAGAVQWAKARGCRLLKIETQNVNVSACRFYARQGCELSAINRFAYPDLPDEVQLVWYFRINPQALESASPGPAP